MKATDEEQREAVDREQSILKESSNTLSALSDSSKMVSWDRVIQHSLTDFELQELHRKVSGNLTDDPDSWPHSITEYFHVRNKLSTADTAVLYNGRIIIPRNLRAEILEILHSGHQGVTGMQARARESIYWPGMDTDISNRRYSCNICDRIAPSLPNAPPAPLPRPEYPFQQVASDYFSLEGRNYLVMVDRYSNWPSVYPATSDGAKELVRI